MQQLLWEVLQNAPGFGFILLSKIDIKKESLNSLCVLYYFHFQLIFV